MATPWRDWPIIRQTLLYARLTTAQRVLCDQLLERGWEMEKLYHRSLYMMRQRVAGRKLCRVKITPSGTITKG